MQTTTAPAALPRRLLLIKSQTFKHSAGYYLSGDPPRWHKVKEGKKAPAKAPKAAHPQAVQGKPVQFTPVEWEQVKQKFKLDLAPSNTNAATVEKQLNALKHFAEVGDATAILASGYGTNGYGQKLSILANHLLGQMGLQHQVVPGQKIGTHAAIGQSPAADAPTKDEALQAAVDHLKEDAKQGDLPAKEKAEDAELVQKLEAAKDGAPLAGALAMPAFEEGKTTTGVVAYYEKVAQQILDMAAAGDTAGLEKMKADGLKPNSKGKVSNTFKGKTANSKMLLALHAQALSAADGKFPEPAAPADQPAPIVSAEPVPVPAAPAAEVSPPPAVQAPAASKLTQIPWDSLKLPDSNSNAKQHNGTVDKIKALAEAGDVAGLQALYDKKSGSKQTYIKKQALLAQTALAAMQEVAPAEKADAIGPKVPDFKNNPSAWNSYAGTLKTYADNGDWEALQAAADQEPNSPEGEQAAEYAKQLLQHHGKAAEQGPKEGDTKQGADGMLVLKDGHWVKMDQEQPKADLKGNAAKITSYQTASGPDDVQAEGKALFEALPADLQQNLQQAVEKEKAKAAAPAPSGKKLKASEAIAIGKGFKTATGKKAELKAMAVAGDVEGLKQFIATHPQLHASKKYAQALIDAMTDGEPAPQPKAATAPVQVAAESLAGEPKGETVKAGVTKIDSWQQTGSKLGSNDGGKFKDKAGKEWYCKFPATEGHAKNEVLAAKFYQMLGIKVPKLKLVEKGGKVGIASQWVDGMAKGDAKTLASTPGALSGFVADAWLANWDVVGLSNDNLMIGTDGKAVRVDVGGSLLYRATGPEKGSDFGEAVGELETLLDPVKNGKSAAVFGGITKADMRAGAHQLAKMHPNQIRKMCRMFGPGNSLQQSALAEKLIARRAYILEKLGVQDPWNKPEPDITKLVVDPSALPIPVDFENYNGPGKGLSSVALINKQNTIDDAALIEFAKQGNLKALQDYHYDAYDKSTGAYIGKKPIAEHPAKIVKNHWADLCDLLTAIAHPPVEGLDLPPIDGGSLEEVSEAAGSFKPGENVSTISKEKVLGFWMKLGHVGAEAVQELMPAETKYFKKSMVAGAKQWYKACKEATKALVNAIQDSGANNRFWNQGQKTIAVSSKGHSYSGPAQQLATQVYADAAELEEGTVLGRWMNMPESMMNQLLKEGAGLVFQNADTMCTSVFKDWGANAKFGTGAFMNIRCAKGAKAMLSLGSGRFNGGTENADGSLSYSGGEMEVTTLMGQRFVVLGVKKGNASSPNGITLDVLMLPPHEGFVTTMGEMAALGKSMLAAIL